MNRLLTLVDMLADAEACNARLGATGARFGSKMRVKERRSKVAEHMKRGLSGAEISREMGENQSTICADIRAIKEGWK